MKPATGNHPAGAVRVRIHPLSLCMTWWTKGKLVRFLALKLLAAWSGRANQMWLARDYSSWRSLGSNRSRSQSPNRLRDITVSKMAMAGMVASHH